VLAWRRLRALDASVAAPSPQLELLHRIPIFRPLPPATLEQLARELQPARVPAGEVIVRQGEPGDRFYIVEEGEVEVRIDDVPIQRLQSGEYFGEIALLKDVPRTATVVAATDVELRTLERDEFVTAVTGHAESAEAAHAVIANRLASLRPGIASV
jgi:CRP-like cAMP-binding protein